MVLWAFYEDRGFWDAYTLEIDMTGLLFVIIIMGTEFGLLLFWACIALALHGANTYKRLYEVALCMIDAYLDDTPKDLDPRKYNTFLTLHCFVCCAS